MLSKIVPLNVVTESKLSNVRFNTSVTAKVNG